MTLPNERFRAVVSTEDFLIKLATHKYARTSEATAEVASRLLRHYPSLYEMRETAKKCPLIWEDTP